MLYALADTAAPFSNPPDQLQLVTRRGAAAGSPPAPNAAAIYHANVVALEQTLNDADIRTEAAEISRSPIHVVFLKSDEDALDKLAAKPNGDLAMIFGFVSELAPGARGRKLIPINKQLPEHLFRGTCCRWLRGHATGDPTIRQWLYNEKLYFSIAKAKRSNM